MSQFSAFSIVEGALASVYQPLFLVFATIRQYVLGHIDVFAPIGILQIVLLSWVCAVMFMTGVLFALRRIVKYLRSQRSRRSLRKQDYEYDLEMCEDGRCEEHRIIYLGVGRERGKTVNRKGGQYVLVPVMIERNDRIHED